SKCTRSQPCSPQSSSASGVSTVRKRALSRRSGFSSAATPASSRAAAAGRRGSPDETLDTVRAGSELGEPGRQPLAQPRQIGNRHLVLASRRTQRKEPLLDFLELTRVGLEAARRRL